jgi:hypothetical protein
MHTEFLSIKQLLRVTVWPGNKDRRMDAAPKKTQNKKLQLLSVYQ